jgi:dipeptidyl aminopeptidase/acylaminoacyl peptidase
MRYTVADGVETAREQGDTADLKTARAHPDRSIYRYRPDPPDGEPGMWALYTWDRGTGEHRRLTDPRHGVLDAAVSADGSWVYWFKPSGPGSEVGAWVGQPFDSSPGDEVAVAPGLGAGAPRGYSAQAGKFAFALDLVGDLPPDGKRFAVLVAEPDGAVHRIAADDDLILYAPTLSADGRLVAFTNGPISDAWAEVRRTSDGTLVRRVGGREGLTVVPVEFSPDPRSHELLLLREGEGNDRRGLMVADADDPTDERRLSAEGVEGELVQRWTSWWITEAQYAPDGRTAVGVFSDGFNQRIYRYDLTRPQEPPTLVPTEQGALKNVTARPGGVVEYQWTNVFTAEEYRSTTGLPFPFPPEKQPDLREHEARVERLWVDVPEGRLSVVVLTPSSPPPPGGHPLLLGVHGGPVSNVTNAPQPKLYEAAVKKGAVLVLPDYLGSGGYGRAWRTGIYGRAGTTELDHLEAAVDAVLARGAADPRLAVNRDRMAAYGYSYGAFLSVLLMTRGFPAAVVGAPLLDPETNHADPAVVRGMTLTHETHFGGPPDASPRVRAAWHRASALRHVADITGPLHVIRFTLDSRYGFRQAKAFEEAARRHGRDNVTFTDFADGHDSGVRAPELTTSVRAVETERLFALLGIGDPRVSTPAPDARAIAASDPGRSLDSALKEANDRGPRQAARRSRPAPPPGPHLGQRGAARPRGRS